MKNVLKASLIAALGAAAWEYAGDVNFN